MNGKVVYIALVLLAFTVNLYNPGSLASLFIFLLVLIRVSLLKNKMVFIVSVLVLILFFIRMTVNYSSDSSLSFLDNQNIVVNVKQTSLKIDGNKLSFEGIVQTNDLKEKVMVTYYLKEESEKQHLSEYLPEKVLVKGIFSQPLEPSNFNQFNYKKYLKNKQIFNLLTAAELKALDNNKSKGFDVYSLDSFRQRILFHIDRTMSEPAAVYTKTLLFADKRTFSSEVMQTFKNLGILHLLSISGLHVIFLINLIRFTLLRINFSKETTSSLLLLFLPIYGIMTGLGVSVIRAIGQTWFKLMSSKLHVSLTRLDSWALILIITLYIQPYSFNTVGFQLSYLISFVIIVVTHQSFYKSWSVLRSYVGLNLILFVCSIPVLTYHFYEFSWGVLILNSLFIPFIASFLLPLLVLNLLLSVILPHSVIFTFTLLIIDGSINMMEGFADALASNVSFTFITGRLSLIVYFTLVFFIILLLLLVEKDTLSIKLWFPLTGILLCIISLRYSPYGQVLMIDVDQGEAILIKQPWGKGNYLIDTGGQIDFPVEEWKKRDKEYRVGKHVMVPVLKSEGVYKLESVIITHADIDHYGALIDIISEIKTQQVVSAKATFYQENFQALFPSIEKYGTIIREADEGSSAALPDNTVAILSKDGPTEENRNNSSLVLLGLLGNKTWLFTGDLEAEGEIELLAKYPNLTVDVLKVAHHGSQTSTHEDFLRQLSPETAWISCGLNNRYGHPHKDVIEKIDAQHTVIYRTDQDGAVIYKYTDSIFLEKIGESVFSFESMRERRGE